MVDNYMRLCNISKHVRCLTTMLAGFRTDGLYSASLVHHVDDHLYRVNILKKGCYEIFRNGITLYR